MKNNTTLILLAAAGAAAYLLLKSKPASGGTKTRTNTDLVSEILNNDTPGQAGYGWRYFDNGVAISPNGIYYKNGVEVWRH